MNNELKLLSTLPNKYEESYRVIVNRAKEEHKRHDYSTEHIFTQAKKIGYSPLEFIVTVDKVYDFIQVAKIWSEHYGIPFRETGDVKKSYEWYIELQDGSLGVANPINYINLVEMFPDKEICIYPQLVLDMREMSDDGIKGYFYKIIQNAQQINASDLHIEIKEYGYEIKARIVGEIVLLDIFPLEKSYSFQQVVKNIASNYSQINTEQWNVSQDARIEIPERKLDLRIAFTPSITEKYQNFVIRLLTKEHTRIKGKEDIEKLGYSPSDTEVIIKYNDYKTGVNIISGATGSGKSRSINSLVSLIDSSRSIRTVEDPVEYVLENAVQHQTFEIKKSDSNTSVVMDYLAYTLAFMRQDPDVIFIGEWRKIKELTEAILYASETGHLVFSTLHSSRVINIPNLLVNQYGIQKEDIANNFNILINQKLIKKVCSHCCSSRIFKREDLAVFYSVKMQDKYKLDELVGKEVKVKNEKGCSHCRIYHPQKEDELLFSGYSGRTVLYEYLPFLIEVRELVSKKTNSLDIESLLIDMSKRGLAKTYVDIAIEKLLDGQADVATIASELMG